MQTARGKTEVGKYIVLLQQGAQGRAESQSLSHDMVGTGQILLCVYIYPSSGGFFTFLCLTVTVITPLHSIQLRSSQV